MKISCNYCGSYINDYDETCANCGAVNDGFKRSSNGQPTTIEELQKWYIDHNLPPEHVTRFFIGKDVHEPKAFGIYKDESGKCTVYKNKDTGERAIRYEGFDEAYAVNEIYLKLKEKIAINKAGNASGGRKNRKKKSSSSWITFIIIIIIAGIIIYWADATTPTRGYYYYDDYYYYYLDGSYYYYDDYNGGWYYYGSGAPFDGSYKDYYVDDDYDSYGVSDFSDTEYYNDWYENYGSNDSDSGWDSDSNWDSSDSWDSGSDWGSDW